MFKIERESVAGEAVYLALGIGEGGCEEVLRFPDCWLSMGKRPCLERYRGRTKGAGDDQASFVQMSHGSEHRQSSSARSVGCPKVTKP